MRLKGWIHLLTYSIVHLFILTEFSLSTFIVAFVHFYLNCTAGSAVFCFIRHKFTPICQKLHKGMTSSEWHRQKTMKKTGMKSSGIYHIIAMKAMKHAGTYHISVSELKPTVQWGNWYELEILQPCKITRDGYCITGTFHISLSELSAYRFLIKIKNIIFMKNY